MFYEKKRDETFEEWRVLGRRFLSVDLAYGWRQSHNECLTADQTTTMTVAVISRRTTSNFPPRKCASAVWLPSRDQERRSERTGRRYRNERAWRRRRPQTVFHSEGRHQTTGPRVFQCRLDWCNGSECRLAAQPSCTYATCTMQCRVCKDHVDHPQGFTRAPCLIRLWARRGFPPPGEFSTLFFSETPMSPKHFLLVLQSGDWGVCEL